MTDFDRFQSEIDMLVRVMLVVRERVERPDLKLISTGTDHSAEHHWRFRTPSGQIVILKVEVEKP